MWGKRGASRSSYSIEGEGNLRRRIKDVNYAPRESHHEMEQDIAIRRSGSCDDDPELWMCKPGPSERKSQIGTKSFTHEHEHACAVWTLQPDDPAFLNQLPLCLRPYMYSTHVQILSPISLLQRHDHNCKPRTTTERQQIQTRNEIPQHLIENARFL